MKTSTKSILGGRVEVIGPADCVGAVASHIETTISGPAAAVQPLRPVLDDPPKQCSCPNCDWAGTSAEMKWVYPDIPDLAERMDPGEECPVGECPQCGALCHEIAEASEPLKVVIKVRGGVAEVTTCPAGVEVEILDHDNEGR